MEDAQSYSSDYLHTKGPSQNDGTKANISILPHILQRLRVHPARLAGISGASLSSVRMLSLFQQSQKLLQLFKASNLPLISSKVASCSSKSSSSAAGSSTGF